MHYCKNAFYTFLNEIPNKNYAPYIGIFIFQYIVIWSFTGFLLEIIASSLEKEANIIEIYSNW